MSIGGFFVYYVSESYSPVHIYTTNQLYLVCTYVCPCSLFLVLQIKFTELVLGTDTLTAVSKNLSCI